MDGKKNVFDDYLTIKTVFKNKEVLRPTYTPEQLPHRHEQIGHLASIFVAALKNQTPSNILIYGKTGTGKTAVTKYLGLELEKKAKEMTATHTTIIHKLTMDFIDDDKKEIIETCYNFLGFKDFFGEDFDALLKIPIHYLYINCQHVDTHYRVLTHIANTFIQNWDDRLPLTGWPTDEVYNRLLQNIDLSGGVTTIVLDEIDKLVEKSGDDLLYTLTRINSDLKYAKATVIGITNSLKFTELLDARVKSSLGEEELVFPPYDAVQLQDILTQRAKEAFNDGSLDTAVIPLCAGLAAQEHGDARRALDLLRVSAELAERDSASVIDERYVRKAVNKIEQDTIATVIQQLPAQSKLVLYGIILIEESDADKINTGMVFDAYKSLCKKVHMDILTQRRVTDLISELDMLGIIDARLVSFGRGGRTRLIELSVPIPDAKLILAQSDFLAPILSYKPAIQMTLI